MRRASAAHSWNKVYDRPYPSRLSQFDYAKIIGLGEGTLSFNGGITAICGANGAGKSTLLQAIQHIFSEQPSLGSVQGRVHFSLSTLTAHLTHNGQEVTRTVTFQSDKAPDVQGAPQIPILLINPASDSTAMVDLLSGTTNIDELLEGFEPKVLNDKDRKIRSAIIGKDYEEIAIYEVDDLEPAIPYFRVTSGGHKYGSETMGLGELAIHLMLWQLDRIQDGSILLIEEPETYISPRSQLALMDSLASMSARRAIWTIITTHSPQIVASIPRAHIRLVSREQGTVSVIANPTQMQLETILGIRPAFRGMAFVEDKVARIWLVTILDQLASDVLMAYEVLDVGSAEKITAILENFPTRGEWLKMIGIYDAGYASPAKNALRPFTFLPGVEAPEAELRKTAIGNKAQLASLLGRTPEDLAVVLGQLEGSDHHDWLEEFAKLLRISIDRAVWALTYLWLSVQANKAAAIKLIDTLRALLYGTEINDSTEPETVKTMDDTTA